MYNTHTKKKKKKIKLPSNELTITTDIGALQAPESS